MIVIFGVWLYFRDPAAPHLNPQPSPTPYNYKTVTYIDGVYGYDITLVDSALASLIPNFSEQKSVAELMQANSCHTAINGGFYSEESRPLGLVIAQGGQLARPIPSSLFNGFLSINDSGQAQISSTEYSTDHIALQTGPMLISNSDIHDLRLTDDKTSRRMVAAITDQNKLVFVAVFNPQAEILGPRLDDLPQIITEIASKENLTFRSAINLDGGRASAYYSDEIQLPEVTWVGALLCVGAPVESI